MHERQLRNGHELGVRAGFAPQDDRSAEAIGAAIDDISEMAYRSWQMPGVIEIVELLRVDLADEHGEIDSRRFGFRGRDIDAWLSERATALYDVLVERFGPLAGGRP